MPWTEVLIFTPSSQCFFPFGQTQMEATRQRIQGGIVYRFHLPRQKGEGWKGYMRRQIEHALFIKEKATAHCTICKALYTHHSLTVLSPFNLCLIFLIVLPPTPAKQIFLQFLQHTTGMLLPNGLYIGFLLHSMFCLKYIPVA